jgi:hypothetical protein
VASRCATAHEAFSCSSAHASHLRQPCREVCLRAGRRALIGADAKESARVSSRRRLANLQRLFELYVLEEQIGHQPPQP